MELSNPSEVDIKIDDLCDLLARTTNNLIAETEVPKLLRDTIRSGGHVFVLDDASRSKYELRLSNSDNFSLILVAPSP